MPRRGEGSSTVKRDKDQSNSIQSNKAKMKQTRSIRASSAAHSILLQCLPRVAVREQAGMQSVLQERRVADEELRLDVGDDPHAIHALHQVRVEDLAVRDHMPLVRTCRGALQRVESLSDSSVSNRYTKGRARKPRSLPQKRADRESRIGSEQLERWSACLSETPQCESARPCS